MKKMLQKMLALTAVVLLSAGYVNAQTSVHQPGVYATTYEQTLVTHEGESYEIYAAKRGGGSSVPVLAAGGNSGYTVATNTTLAAFDAGWLAFDAINSTQTNAVSNVANQFSGITMGFWQFRNANGMSLKVKGYDEIAFVIADNHASTANRQFTLTVNGTSASLGSGSNSVGIRTVTLNPEIESTLVLKCGNDNQNHSFYGFSLRVASTSLVQEDPIISSFTIAGVTATIDDEAETITAELSYGTDLTALTPEIILGGIGDSYTPTGEQDFSAGSINYVVSDESGDVSKTYAVTITASTTPSSDATLSDLMVNGITIDGFSPTTDTYVVSVPNGTTDTGNTYNVTATTNAAEASVEITPTQLTFGNVTIAVTAADGETTKEYYITFEEAPETPNFISLYFATGSSTYSFTNAATGELSGDVCSALANNASPHCLPNGIESGRRTSNITNFSITLNSTSVQDLILYLRAGGSNPARQLETVSIDDVDVTEAVTITNNSISTSGYTALTIESLNAEIGSVINFIFSANVAFNYLDVTPMVSEPGDGTSLENTVASSRIVFDGQNIFNLEGALLEVFDTTGRVVVRSSNEVIDLSGMQGIFIVKSAKETMKIAVTK